MRLFYCCLLVFFVSSSPCLFAQSAKEKPDAALQKKLAELVKPFKGDVGVYVRHLKTGQTAAVNADTLFPTASLVKVPIMLGLFDKIERGELDYHRELVYKDSLLYPGESDLVGLFKDGSKVGLSKIAMLMITTSDNTASLWCQHLAGTGTEINKWLETNGFRHTRVNSRTPGRESARKAYGKPRPAKWPNCWCASAKARP